MTTPVLIAAELRELLSAAPVSGAAVSWIAADEPTPAGPFVAIVPLLSRVMGSQEFDRLPELRLVANCAVGYDNIDLEGARARGVRVTNTPDVLTAATADLTWALILSVARRLREGQELVASGRWGGWHPTQLLGLELSGATLGIVGAGRIGCAVGVRGAAFGMRVLYHDTKRRPAFERETGAAAVVLDVLLEESDVVTVHVPSAVNTRDMFDAACFARMKRGAVFVNTARGDVVKEDALLEALDTGVLAGAGLDVFRSEPAVPRGLVSHPRVVALPHLGSATTMTRRAMAELACRNVVEVLAGRPPLTPVV